MKMFFDFFVTNPISFSRAWAFFYYGIFSAILILIVLVAFDYYEVKANGLSYVRVSGVIKEIDRSGRFYIGGVNGYVFSSCGRYKANVGDNVSVEFVYLYSGIKTKTDKKIKPNYMNVNGKEFCSNKIKDAEIYSKLESSFVFYVFAMFVVFIFYYGFCGKISRK